MLALCPCECQERRVLSAASRQAGARQSTGREVSAVAHDDRRLRVLRAIVQDYVSTNDPVGSKALAARYDLGVSPATIRNDMAGPEEGGYITPTPTTTRRGPPDNRYPLFGGRRSATQPPSAAQ